jgi:hypothetical protein
MGIQLLLFTPIFIHPQTIYSQKLIKLPPAKAGGLIEQLKLPKIAAQSAFG